MTTSTENITAAQWLDVRDAVAAIVKEKSNIQATTTVAIAERLLRAGLIDIAAVLEHIKPAPTGVITTDVVLSPDDAEKLRTEGKNR